MKKKLISIILCLAILTTLCLSASATTVTFNGTTSGGTRGTTTVAGKISTDTSCAYYAGAGFYTSNPSESNFSLSVIGSLYVIRSPRGNNRVIDRVMPFNSLDPGMGNVGKMNGETDWPSNGFQSQYYYQKVVLSVSYSGAAYGSWSGSGQMNY